MRLEVRRVCPGSVSLSRLSATEPRIFWDSRWCPEGDLNPHDRLRSADFKSAASADFAIRAWKSVAALIILNGNEEKMHDAGAAFSASLLRVASAGCARMFYAGRVRILPVHSLRARFPTPEQEDFPLENQAGYGLFPAPHRVKTIAEVAGS